MENINKIKFRSDKHKSRFYELVHKMHAENNRELLPLAYLFALDNNLQLNDCFDFKRHCIKSDVFTKDWITHTDEALITLAFNLYNSFDCNVCETLCHSGDFLPYMIEAIKIRFNA